jgi:undecaprenyl-diphosphatase
METSPLLVSLLHGIVEGLTEFLPVSSTGHLIIVSDLFGVNDEKGKVFDIVIQLGAILAVVWEYRARFAKVISGLGSDPVQQRFAANLAIAFVPAAAIGFLFASAIKARLFNPVTVAIALIAGALVIFWVESRPATTLPARVEDTDQMSWRDALWVGIAQCFALIPGTSRSGATIIGGMLAGLSRKAATEFSFYLAVPILFAATGYQVVKYRSLFVATDRALCRRVRYLVHLRDARGALAAALRVHARLQGLRVVPDRAGDRRAGVVLLRRRAPPAAQAKADSSV